MNKLTMNFPKQVAALRKHLHLSQKEFAEKVGVVPSYVSMLERGQRTPTLDVIDQIAERCNVDPQILVRA